MKRFALKLVPDAEPDADGEWIVADLPADVDPFALAPRDGYHVVAVGRPDDPRDGGPMHLMGRVLPPAPYQFSLEWVTRALAHKAPKSGVETDPA